MSRKNRKKVIHATTHITYDKRERKNIFSQIDVLFLLRC